jgi:hypothetical protein
MNDKVIGVCATGAEERAAMEAVAELGAVEKAALDTALYCEGSYRHEYLQRRVDNAVKIYTAKLIVEALNDIDVSLTVAVATGISDAVKQLLDVGVKVVP